MIEQICKNFNFNHYLFLTFIFRQFGIIIGNDGYRLPCDVFGQHERTIAISNTGQSHGLLNNVRSWSEKVVSNIHKNKCKYIFDFIVTDQQFGNIEKWRQNCDRDLQ